MGENLSQELSFSGDEEKSCERYHIIQTVAEPKVPCSIREIPDEEDFKVEFD